MAIGQHSFYVIGELDDIDGKVVGDTKTVDESMLPMGSHLSPLFAIFETMSVDAITETAIVSIGTNSPDYDNILAAHGIKPVEGAIETVLLPCSQMVDSETDIYVRVLRAASGTELLFKAGLGCLAY